LADAQAMVGYFADAGASSIAALPLSQSFLIACPTVKDIMKVAFGWGQKVMMVWLHSPVW
jgi:hypothetical protein